MFEWGLSLVGWGYVWAVCNVYWLDLPSLNIERKAARWIATEALPRGCMGTKAPSFHPETEAFFSLFSPQASLTLPLAYSTVTLVSPSSFCTFSPFLCSFTSLSLSLSFSNSPATLHWADLRLTAAMKDEPGSVASSTGWEPWHLLVWWERQRDYKRHFWIMSEIPIAHLSSISNAMIVTTQLSNSDYSPFGTIIQITLS